jgi:RNA polymerase sigma-70 factor (ECF subfamily)
MGPIADRHTFDRLVREHLPAAHRFALRLTGDAEAAEELAQEALGRAAGAWRTFAGRSTFRTWLLQIVVNAFRDHLRRRGIDASTAELPDGQAHDVADPRSADPLAEASAEELGRIIAGMVSSLPPRQREVLVLVAYEHLSPTEAAAVMGVTEQNARTNLHFARERLRRQLGPYVDERRPTGGRMTDGVQNGQVHDGR